MSNLPDLSWEMLRDDRELERVVLERNSRLLVFALGILRCRQKAEDVVQDLWLGVSRDRWRYSGEVKAAYFYVVVMRAAWEERKKLSREQGRGDVDPKEDVLNYLEAMGAVMDAVDHTELKALLEQALATLNEKEQTVVRLRFESELGITEIADAMQIPQGSVGSALYPALRKMREAMGEQLQDFLNE